MDLGQQLFFAPVTPIVRIKRAFLSFIGSIFIAIVAIIAFINPDTLNLTQDDLWLRWMFLASTIIIAIVSFMLASNIKSIAIYEYGVVIGEGKKQQTFMYYETSVMDYITKHSVNFIPVGKTHTVKLIKYTNFDGEEKESANLARGVANRKQAVQVLLEAHTNHWLKNLTPETIPNINMRFTTTGSLTLNKGEFTYVKGLRREVSTFSLNQITDIISGNGIVQIVSGLNAKGRNNIVASISTTETINLTILFHIIDTSINTRNY